jgi:hypothetical protein
MGPSEQITRGSRESEYLTQGSVQLHQRQHEHRASGESDVSERAGGELRLRYVERDQ